MQIRNAHTLTTSLISNPTYELSPSSSLNARILYQEHRICGMQNIVHLVKECCMNDELIATIKPVDDSNGFFVYSDWFRPFIPIFNSVTGMSQKEIEKFQLCEEIICFYKAKDLLTNDVNLFGLFESFKAQNLTYLQNKTKLLNSFAQLIREQMNCKEIRLAIRNRVKNCESNFKSSRRLINECFRKYGKIFILRIDFGFKVPLEILNPHNRTNDLENSFHALDNFILLKQQMKRFLNNKRHLKSLNKIKSYILKFEHGIKKGFHSHAIFILDNNEYETNYHFMSELTEYWEDLTNGSGCTYDCRISRQKMKRIGTGVIHPTDTKKRAVLESCLKYLCTQDNFFRFRALKGAKTMQISQIPKRHTKIGDLKNTIGGKKNVK